MIPAAPLFEKEYGDETFIDDINEEIKQLNQLINIYNSAAVAKKAEALLQIRQQLLKLDASIGGMSTLGAIAMGTLEYDKFYGQYAEYINQELKALGCPGLSEPEINQWEIENCRTIESIPSATLFAEETKPGFFARLFGARTSTPINKATDLLSQLNSSTIHNDTEENYYQLTRLKLALRGLIASEPMSNSDRAMLNNLIARVNHRLHDIVDKIPKLESKVYPPPLANIAQRLGNLSYDDAKKVTNALTRPQSFEAETFHQQFDSMLPGLSDYTVKYLGGVNAKNYSLVNNETGEHLVLKITPSAGNTRRSYERLKNTSVRSGIAAVYASKNGIKADDYKMYSLELTEFCDKGDVLSQGLNIQKKIDLIKKDIASEQEESDAVALNILYEEFGLAEKAEVSRQDKEAVLAQLQERQIQSATNIYSQTADILLSFQANNAFFPDAKPTNFLVNEFDEVLIADTKTFVDTNNGVVDQYKISKTGLLQYSPGFRSPQFENGDNLSADKEHAYLMGMSLYCYLTGTDITHVPKEAKGHADFLDFTKEVFQSPKGQKFKALIEGLTQPEPEQRLGMEQAKEQLKSIAHDIKVEASPFKSKTEASFYALHSLMEIDRVVDNDTVKNAVAQMKILIENHEQDPKVIAKLLNDTASALMDPKQQKHLQNIAAAVENSAYEQTLQEKYENPLARRFESEMQIALLKKPTEKMMQSVDHMSKALLDVFKQLEDHDYKDVLEEFAKNLTSGMEQTGFGSQPEEMTIEGVKQLLQDNNPDNLNQILYVHFLFAQKWMRQLPPDITPPNQNPPTGKMLELVKEYNDGEYRDNPQAFFDKFDMQKLKFISDRQIYGSDLFRADPTRGREGPLHKTFSNQMGLMLEGQNQDGLGTDRSRWTPDSKYQGVNLHSPFARDLFENGAIYAAGPFGMTSLFLGIMENYGNFQSVEEKQHYFAAVSAYMVSGGLHSLHEVLGPAQYALDLIPGYQVSPPDENKLAKPPNFHQFYQQQMALDPEFQKRYDKGWDNMMAAYARQQDQFIHAPISDVSIAQQRVFDISKPESEAKSYQDLSDTEIRQAAELWKKANQALKEEQIDVFLVIQDQLANFLTKHSIEPETLREKLNDEQLNGGHILEQIYSNCGDYSRGSSTFIDSKFEPGLVSSLLKRTEMFINCKLPPNARIESEEEIEKKTVLLAIMKNLTAVAKSIPDTKIGNQSAEILLRQKSMFLEMVHNNIELDIYEKLYQAKNHKDISAIIIEMASQDNNPYNKLKAQIQLEIIRILQYPNEKSRHKVEEIKAAYDDAISFLEQGDLSDMDKAKTLFDKVSDSLKINRGLNIRTPLSYKNVKNVYDQAKVPTKAAMSQSSVKNNIDRLCFKNEEWKEFIRQCAQFTPDTRFMQVLGLGEKLKRTEHVSNFDKINDKEALRFAVAFVIKAISTPADSSVAFADNAAMHQFLDYINDENLSNDIREAIYDIVDEKDGTLTAQHFKNNEKKITDLSNRVLEYGLENVISIHLRHQ